MLTVQHSIAMALSISYKIRGSKRKNPDLSSRFVSGPKKTFQVCKGNVLQRKTFDNNTELRIN